MTRKLIGYASEVLLLFLNIGVCAVPARAQSVTSAESEVSRTDLQWRDGAMRWKPENSIPVRYFGTTVGSWLADTPYFPGNMVSPDGRYFQVVSYRGDLACDCNRSLIQIYSSAAVLAALKRNQVAPRPLAEASFASHGGGDIGYSDPKWSADGSSLYFLEYGDYGRKQIYQLDVPTAKLTMLTHETGELSSSFILEGPILLFQRIVETTLPPPAYPASPAPRDSDGDVIVQTAPPPAVAWGAVVDGKAWDIPLDRPWSGGGRSTLSLSPDGSKAIFLYVEQEAVGDAHLNSKHSHFLLIDFKQRQVRSLGIDGPDIRANLRGVRAYWSEDSSHAIIANARMEDGSLGLIDFESATGRTKKLEAGLTEPAAIPSPEAGAGSFEAPRIAATWLEMSRTLVVPQAGGRPARFYSFGGQGWAWHEGSAAADMRGTGSKDQATQLPDGLSITIRESANEPQVLIASAAGRNLILSAPDPSVSAAWRAKAVPVALSVPKKTTALLYVPKDSPKGAKLPLVIQIGDIGVNRFSTEGAVSAFATQALVARDIAVLNLPYFDINGTAQEGRDNVARLDEAVAVLARSGLIDPKRVGLVGFSRSGYLVQYAITHPQQTKFAAAEAEDNTTFTYAQLIALALTSKISGVYATKITGDGRSFWQDPARWIANDNDFSADKSKTPVLFTDPASKFDIGVMGKIAAMQLTRRPFDQVIYADAGHPPRRPLERVFGMTLTADWMDFWLNGREDAAPAKAAQYQRWRMIRDKWRVQQTWEAAGNPVGSEPKGGQQTSRIGL